MATQGVAVTSTGKAAEADVACIDAGQTLRQAGHLMRELGVVALRVRGENGKIQGTISSDMVVSQIAAGGDPKTVTVGDVAVGPGRKPGRSRGATARSDDHGPDPGEPWPGWALAERGRAWQREELDAAASPGADIAAFRRRPGLVA